MEEIFLWLFVLSVAAAMIAGIFVGKYLMLDKIDYWRTRAQYWEADAEQSREQLDYAVSGHREIYALLKKMPLCGCECCEEIQEYLKTHEA